MQFQPTILGIALLTTAIVCVPVMLRYHDRIEFFENNFMIS